MLIVQKFGGSSLADISGLRRAAEIILYAVNPGCKVAAVVSAMGDSTDELCSLAHRISPKPCPRELDALLATVQMPTGSPVATGAINGGGNAALIAAQILALSDDELAKRLEDKREADAEAVLAKDAAIAREFNY